jgi:hypothetical protein
MQAASMRSLPQQIYLISSPNNRQVSMFAQTLADLGLPAPHELHYHDILSGQVQLQNLIKPNSLVRLESPGRDLALERELIVLGAELADPDGEYQRLSAEQLAQIPIETGLFLGSRQWYLGWRHLLGLIEQQLAQAAPHQLMNHPAEIALMFDKVACHTALQAAGVRVPPSLGVIQSYSHLIDSMQQRACARVFLKPAHGSSAAGVVAFQLGGDKQLATTTLQRDHEGKWFTSTKLQRYTNPEEIRDLVDMLGQQRLHSEQWIPKAQLGGKVFDLRILVVQGQAQHVAVRMSHSPITNLRLGNQHGSWEAVRARISDEAWQELCQTCQSLSSVLPRSLYAGVDMLIGRNFRSHAILELNAFGDLLPHTRWQGRSSYQSELLALYPQLIRDEAHA